MIGVLALILLAIYMHSYLPLIGIIPYVLLFLNEDVPFLAVYFYLLILILLLPRGSVYSGQTLALASSTVLVVDETLRGIKKPEVWELFGGASLLASMVYPLLFPFSVAGIAAYSLLRRLGRSMVYLAGWTAGVVVVLLLLRGKLMTVGSEAMVVVGLGVVPLLIAEWRDGSEV